MRALRTPSRGLGALAPLLAACISLLACGVVRAQAAAVPAILEGTYHYPHAPTHAQAIALAAVEPRISAMPAMVQGLARDRVAERVRPARRILIAPREGGVRVELEDGGTMVVDTALGATTTVRSRQGRPVQVRQALQGGWLEQVFTGENGELRQLYSTEPDGRTLHLDVTLSSPSLGEPVRYRLDYLRE